MSRSSTLAFLAIAGLIACGPKTPTEPAADAQAEPAPTPMIEDVEASVATLEGIRSSVVHLEGLDMHVLHSGPSDGVPVLFVHGNVSSATFWEATMLALPEGMRAVAPDLRGYGDSQAKPIDPSRGLDDMAEDVWALVDALELGAVHVVGHSMGGGVVQKMLLQRPAGATSVTLVAPLSPYGYGGSKGDNGEQTFADGGPSGVNPDFVKLLQEGNTALDNPASPKNIFRAFYVKPPFVPEREDALVASMLTTQVGPDFYPGSSVESENWPGVAPGKTGVLPSMSRMNFDASGIKDIDPKPPILWIRGDADQIVSDLAMFDLAALGKVGAVPGWPGDEACPPQPMLAQTRAVLEAYKANGGAYQEVVIADTAHSPYLEKPEEFNAAFHAHLKGE